MARVRKGQSAKRIRQDKAAERIEFYATEEGQALREEREAHFALLKERPDLLAVEVV